MIRIQFTPEVKQTLTALGFTHSNHPAEWRDVGNAERGPKLIGHKEYDEWSKDNALVFVEDGYIVEVEKLPLDYPIIPF